MTMTSTAATDVFRAVADPTRRRLLDLLRDGPKGFQDLHAEVPITKGGLSSQLKVLREVGLVERRQEGRTVSFALSPQPLADVAAWLQPYTRFWDAAFDRLGQVLEGSPDPGTERT
jgi:DNA-binding transcriptional ArsR family regulator